jgi:glutamine synthetase
LTLLDIPNSGAYFVRVAVRGSHNNKDCVMTTDGQRSLAQRLTGIDEIECVTPDLNGVPRGKVMTAEGFLEGRRLQMARGAAAMHHGRLSAGAVLRQR